LRDMIAKKSEGSRYIYYPLFVNIVNHFVLK